MSQILDGVAQGLLNSSPWEFIAMVLSVAYLVLAVRQSIWCWAAAFISTAIYTWVFMEARLYMDSGLQLFYMLMAIYGWSQWRHHEGGKQDLEITARPVVWHATAVAVVLATSLLSGFLLDRYTAAAFPFLDSLTTWASVFATWMVARKVLENWAYWIAIDSLSVYLYFSRELYLTVFLFVIYVLIAVVGWRKWRKEFLKKRGRVKNVRMPPEFRQGTSM